MIRFNARYFSLFIFLLIAEIIIGMYVHDAIVRPYVGDLLVVILIYTFVKSFFNIAPLPLCISVFIFACGVELLQYFHIVNLLGLQHNKLARIIIGTSFSWTDILCYFAGIALIMFAEKFNPKIKTTTKS